MSTSREGRLPIKTEVIDPDLRKGKWTAEEENYANKIISLFNQGMLPVVVGTTLRTYLSDKLRCDPMRITKKYAGASCIGKQVFQLADNYYECFQENERELQRLETLFLARINGKSLSLAGKRNGSSDALLSSHQSIYETNNLERPSSVQPHSTPPLAKRTPKSYRGGGGRGFHGRGSSGRVSSSPGKYRRKQTAIGDALYFGAAGDMNGVGVEGIAERMSRFSDAGASEEEDDYSYAYDPEYDDYEHPHCNNTGMHAGEAARQYFASHGLSYSFAPQGVSAGTGAGHVFTSLGRRILSEPNLTELNLSSWKETDYRPLPADSLKELFSQPIAPAHHHNGFHDDNGTDTLLPEHVYTALGTESGRYAATGRPYMSAAAIAARAQATKKALIDNQRNNATAASKGSNGAYLSKDTADMQSAQFSSLSAKKRSYSAMALVDFEKLAGDDNAAGDLFLQFLTKIGSGNTPPSTESAPTSPTHAATITAISAPSSSTGTVAPAVENKDDAGADATTAPADSSGASLSAGSYSPLSLSATTTTAAVVTAGTVSSTATVTMEDSASVSPSSPGRYAHSGSMGSDSEATTSMQIA